MEEGMDFCFLDNLKTKQQQNRSASTFQCLQGGHFFSSCKMEGEGCENNDLSTYYRFTNQKMYKKNPKLFPKSFMFCTAFFPCFEPKHRIFECFRLVKLTPVLAEGKKHDYFWHFSIIFFPLFLVLLFRATPAPCSDLQKSSFQIVGKTALVQLEVTVKLHSYMHMQSLPGLPFLPFKAEVIFFFL